MSGGAADVMAAPPVDAVIAFNEIMYHPTDPAEAGEWIELHNQMGIDIDLSDWSITGGVDFTFDDGTIIPGGGHLVVARTPGMVPGSLPGAWTGALSNGGETLRLRDKNRRLMDEVTYGDAGEWPVAPDGSGVSLAKANEDGAAFESGSWTASAQVGGTPGEANFPPPPAPVSGRVIDFHSDWRYRNTGSDPGATWAQPGYDDAQAGWQTGTAAFDFGSPTVYGEAQGGASDFQEISGITIADKSSEATSNGLNRPAINVVNGSGLTGAAHGTTPDGTMWLSRGILAPADPLPAHMTFDLGATVNLTSFHVWNYNENTTSDQTARGARSVQVSVAATPGGAFTSVGTFEFGKAGGTLGELGESIALVRGNVRQVRFDIATNWGAANQFVGLSEVKFYSDQPGVPPAPPTYRAPIGAFYATGVDDRGALLDPGDRDPHYLHTATGMGAVVEAGHPAWLGPDGVSQWLGPTANGTDNVPPGGSVYRLSVDLLYWRPATAEISFYPSVDNDLNSLRVNGTLIAGISGGGFGGYLGPYPVPATGFVQGLNTVDIEWTNAGAADNPAGFRAKWEATAEPLLARTTLAANPVTTYFRKNFLWSGHPGSTYQLRLEHLLDDGAVFYLNGSEVLRANMPPGAVGASTQATSDVLYPQFSGVLEIAAGAFVSGNNVLAVELHQSGVASTDALFGMTLDLTEIPPSPEAPPALAFHEISGASAVAGAFFIEIANSGASPLSLEGYRVRGSGGQEYVLGAGLSLAEGGLLSLNEATLGFRPFDGEKLFLVAPGGTAVLDGTVVRTRPRARSSEGAWLVPNATTPGGANTFSLSDSIVINEIMFNHMPVYLPTGTTPDDEEWIELFNRSAAPAELTGWKLRGGADYDFPNGTMIPAGGYLVIAKRAGVLSAKYPGIAILGDWSGSLSNSGDVVRVEDASGNPVDEVRFTEGGRWDGRADGGGSSLELRHPEMDNALAESWAASDETAKATWQTYTYSGLATPPPGSNDPTSYNEFILGLVNGGECLVDDISVIDNSTGGTQLIQDGSFSSGNASFWRLLGTHGLHGRSTVVSEGGNSVLRIVATDPAEHMHNHCETTLKSGGSFHTINSSHSYRISFRAKWQSGPARLQSRLYFNRLNRQHLLPVPANNGTPGAPNSRLMLLPTPTLSGLAQSPVLPEPGVPVEVSVRVSPRVPVSGLKLHWRVDPSVSWNEANMTSTDGTVYVGVLPAQAAGALVQFHVSAQGTNGSTVDFPAEGPRSRALVRWSNGVAPPGPGYGFRILLPEADTNELHTNSQVMSNYYRPCTVVYRESEVFYDAAVRLRSSERGRYGDPRLGFAIRFDPTHKFRGVHEVVNMDRSAYGPGTSGSGFGQVDILNQQMAYRAGGVPAMYNDLVYLIAPRSAHNGSAQMTMAEFNDPYLDSQWDNGADSPTFKFDLVYYPTTTTTGTPEGLKNAQPDLVNAVNMGGLTGSSKEDYRWHFLIGNARSKDDYSRILAFNHAFNRLAAGDASEIEGAIDVDQWLRASAMMSLVNSNDSYSTGGLPHNLKLYVRPEDGRVLYLPWDADFFKQATNFAVIGNADLQRIINARPDRLRVFYGHLHDIIATSYNESYVADWVARMEPYSTAPGNWDEITAYVRDRSAFVLSQCNAAFPSVGFAVTTNGGNDFSTSSPLATVAGNGWINVREIRIRGNARPLGVAWTGGNGWQVQLPVGIGANAFTLEAYDFQGMLVGSDTITITGTGTVVPASAANTVISEFDYHPASPSVVEMDAGFGDREDFEFIELRNIGMATINLANVRFETGITFGFSAGVTIPPGGYAVVARRSAAFAVRYPGVPVAGEYYVASGNVLKNSGEELSLLDAAGADIKRFTYGDRNPWPESADGGGSSLVLIAPDSNPDHGVALNWRASAPSPGAASGDALPAPSNPLGDDNGDGVTNLMEYAAGGLPVMGISNGSVTFDRDARADVFVDLETSEDMMTWDAATMATVSRVELGGGRERLGWILNLAPGTGRSFARVRVRLP
jgi:hypothetical protein